MNETLPLPFYARLALSLISIIAIFVIFYYAQSILIPILIALLFAILLRPVGGFLEAKLRLPHVIATLCSVLLMVLVVAGIFTFISFQVAEMANDWGKIKSNFMIHLADVQQMIRERFDLSEVEQKNIIDDATKDSMGNNSLLGTTLLSFTDILVNLLLIPIYTFLFLLYRTHFMKFLAKLVTSENHDVLHDIMCKVKVSVQSYIVGLLIQWLRCR